MGALVSIGFASFILTSAIVGLRLLRIAARTGEMPELAIGTALFAGGGIGHALIVMAFVLHTFPPAITPIAILLGNAAASVGAIALALGVWRVFRPRDRWPLAIVMPIVVLLVLSTIERLLHLLVVPARPIVFWTFTLASAASYAWSALESLRYYAIMQRRMRIGLADASITRRFLLWGIAGSAAFGIHICAVANRFLDPATIAPSLLIVQDVMGVTAAVGIWFAFFPPRRMREATVSAQ